MALFRQWLTPVASAAMTTHDNNTLGLLCQLSPTEGQQHCTTCLSTSRFPVGMVHDAPLSSPSVTSLDRQLARGQCSAERYSEDMRLHQYMLRVGQGAGQELPHQCGVC